MKSDSFANCPHLVTERKYEFHQIGFKILSWITFHRIKFYRMCSCDWLYLKSNTFQRVHKPWEVENIKCRECVYFVEDKKGESPEDPMLVDLPFFFLNSLIFFSFSHLSIIFHKWVSVEGQFPETVHHCLLPSCVL